MDVQFDKSKALNALLYVANRVKRKDFHKIFKIVYFADRQHLAEWGASNHRRYVYCHGSGACAFADI